MNISSDQQLSSTTAKPLVAAAAQTPPVQSSSSTGGPLRSSLEARSPPSTSRESVLVVGLLLGGGVLGVAAAACVTAGVPLTRVVQGLAAIGLLIVAIRSFRWSPDGAMTWLPLIAIASALLAVVGLANGDTLFGVFFLSLTLLSAGWWAWLLGRPLTADEAIAKEPATSLWPHSWQVTILLIAFYAARSIETGSLTPNRSTVIHSPATQQSAVPPAPAIVTQNLSKGALATQRYWQRSIAALNDEFKPATGASYEGAVDDANLHGLQQLRLIRSFDKQDVDLELVQCVERITRELGKLVGWNLANRDLLLRRTQGKSAANWGKHTESMLGQFLETDPENFPEEYQEGIRLVQSLGTALFELEAMQEKLAKRYPGLDFSWPGEEQAARP